MRFDPFKISFTNLAAGSSLNLKPATGVIINASGQHAPTSNSVILLNAVRYSGEVSLFDSKDLDHLYIGDTKTLRIITTTNTTTNNKITVNIRGIVESGTETSIIDTSLQNEELLGYQAVNSVASVINNGITYSAPVSYISMESHNIIVKSAFVDGSNSAYVPQAGDIYTVNGWYLQVDSSHDTEDMDEPIPMGGGLSLSSHVDNTDFIVLKNVGSYPISGAAWGTVVVD